MGGFGGWGRDRGIGREGGGRRERGEGGKEGGREREREGGEEREREREGGREVGSSNLKTLILKDNSVGFI